MDYIRWGNPDLEGQTANLVSLVFLNIKSSDMNIKLEVTAETRTLKRDFYGCEWVGGTGSGIKGTTPFF